MPKLKSPAYATAALILMLLAVFQYALYLYSLEYFLQGYPLLLCLLWAIVLGSIGLKSAGRRMAKTALIISIILLVWLILPGIPIIFNGVG